MYVPEHFPRYRPTTTPAAATAAATVPPLAPAAVGRDVPPPLTLEWLVARDIDAYTARRRARTAASGLRAAATMEPQASTRPSPASLRKNGNRTSGRPDGPRRDPH